VRLSGCQRSREMVSCRDFGPSYFVFQLTNISTNFVQRSITLTARQSLQPQSGCRSSFFVACGMQIIESVCFCEHSFPERKIVKFSVFEI
jgi:hypothetical protein